MSKLTLLLTLGIVVIATLFALSLLTSLTFSELRRYLRRVRGIAVERGQF